MYQLKDLAIMKHLRKYFTAGLLAVVPLFLVFIVIRFLYQFIDQNVLNLIGDYIGFRVPGLGLLITVVLLIITGWFSRNLFGRWFFRII